METKTSMMQSRALQTNYSALSNLPKQVINQIKHEGIKILEEKARYILKHQKDVMKYGRK